MTTNQVDSCKLQPSRWKKEYLLVETTFGKQTKIASFQHNLFFLTLFSQNNKCAVPAMRFLLHPMWRVMFCW
jgi:hypothetical protein